jgi:hypothetical protein
VDDPETPRRYAALFEKPATNATVVAAKALRWQADAIE